MPTQQQRDEEGRTLRLPKSIRGVLLRDFAASTGTRRVSVIVQPRLNTLPKGSPSLDLAAAKRATTALKNDLAGLGLLDRARSVSVFSGFVLEVTPRQLRLLAKAPGVQSIRPNLRRHKLL